MCADYISTEEPEFTITVSQSDIDFEREKSNREAVYENTPIVDYPDSYLETLAVYRKIVTALLDYNVFLMHGSAVCVNDYAYIFTAPSGVGKTTHTRLWLENIDGAFVINGDKPLIKVCDEKCVVYSTPWSGKEGMNNNTHAALKAICFLERGKDNEIIETPFSSVISSFIQQCYRPSEADKMQKTLFLLKKLGGKVRFYRLSCNMEPDAALLSFGRMSE